MINTPNSTSQIPPSESTTSAHLETAPDQPPISSPEIAKPEGINSIQKEIIDRAMIDPDSRDRLATIIRTFGTPAVKAYLESKLT